jgi:hypothetical protein
MSAHFFTTMGVFDEESKKGFKLMIYSDAIDVVVNEEVYSIRDEELLKWEAVLNREDDFLFSIDDVEDAIEEFVEKYLRTSKKEGSEK